ncbi:MAG TPA: hypothetical protein VHP11_07875 [Tepidisphaeraceae bacterium]|nr:hypothetical protein [Tepidisphaeraceae bacterium]
MMKDPLQDLGERLLSYEPADTQFGEKYRKEISALLRREFPVGRRRAQILCGVVFVLVGLFGVVVLPWMASPPPLFSWWPVFVSCGFMGIVGAAMLGGAIRRTNVFGQQAVWFGFGMLFMVAQGVILLNGSWRAEDAMVRGQLAQGAFVLLAILGVSTIVYFIEYYHKRTQLKLLELEYRLAELTAKITRE